MISSTEAVSLVKKINPKMIIVSAFNLPKVYAFYMTPNDAKFSYTDSWYCIDKQTGSRVDFNPFSDISVFTNAKVIGDFVIEHSDEINDGQYFLDNAIL